MAAENPLDCSRAFVDSVTLPAWLVDALDREAERRGISRDEVINTALVE